jgi:hypothetical protein
LGDRSSVVALLKRTEVESDAANMAAIWSALLSLTGHDLGTDLKAWQRWLNTET